MASTNTNVQDSHLLKDDCSATITLPDGRDLGYARYGAKEGPAIICLHGLPGSRLDFARSDAAAKEVGARIISVDRPGIGLSSPHQAATLLTHAKDVESLTEALGLDTYAVLGGSAGGPYSLACAYALPPDKIKALIVVCGLGNFTDMGPGGMKWWMWFASRYITWFPLWFVRWFWRQDPGAQTHLTPKKHLELLQSIASSAKPHEKEKGLFSTEESTRLWLRTSREAFKNGVDSAVQGSLRLGSDWGFRIQDIRKDLPVWLWYGKFDEIAPVSHGEQIAARLGKNARLKVVDETHGSMFVNQTRAYLGKIVDYMGSDASTAS